MAPPAKRRKRNIVQDSDGENDEPRPSSNANTLQRYLFSPDTKPSPTSTADAIRDPPGSPSPAPRKTAYRSTRSQTAASSSSLGIRNRPPAKSPSTSPEKPRAKAQKKAKVEEKGKSADLVTLFSKQAQKVSCPAPAHEKDESFGVEDFISDPISEDDDVALHKAAVSSVVGKKAQKRFKGSLPSTQASAGSASSGQRFLRPPRPPLGNGVLQDSDPRPWSERFSPLNLDELAVHKKKVADVRKWLEDVANGKLRQSLLVLKGAAGTGKTTTVQLLAKHLNCDVLEWRNPGNSLGATYGFQSASAQFEEFLGRGDKFAQLDLDSSDSDSTAQPVADGTASTRDSSSGRRIMLIEEFPNTFMRSSSALTSFRNSVLQFLAANTASLPPFGQRPPSNPITPVVMVISETLLTTTSASADSFTAHRLLGPEILRHPGTGVIEFNAIAPSLLARALELVVLKEARKSGRRRTPGPLVLKRLGEIGDIRSAISSLEFLCLKNDDEADWGSKVAFTKPKKALKDSITMTKSEQESLELISQRESSLGIFHAVGKVVYNKREELPVPRAPSSSSSSSLSSSACLLAQASAEELPSHLAHCSRPKPSQVSVDTLIDETGTDTHTFISALHENYALSCEQTSRLDPLSSVDYINGCLDYLSDSDLLCPSWDIFFGGRGLSGNYYDRNLGSHILRQDEMGFQVAVRGLLFSLPQPVKRQTSHAGRGGGGGGGGGDAFKMFYPTSLKLWRAKEEIDGLVNMWATKMLKAEEGAGPNPSASQSQATTSGLTNGSRAAFLRNRGGGVAESRASGQKRTTQPAGQPAKAIGNGAEQRTPVVPTTATTTSTTPPPPSPLSLGNTARGEMLLDRLPYVAHIARRRRCSFQGMGVRDLEKIVSFHGIDSPEADESSDDQDDGGSGTAATGDAAWATDKPTEGSSPRKKGLGSILSRSKRKDEGPALAAAVPIQSLVLSDDDIEDD